MADLDLFQSLDSVYLKIVALPRRNELHVEERNTQHLAISKEDVKSLIEKKFSKKGVEGSVIEHEHSEDGYCQYISFIKLKKNFKTRKNRPDIFDWGYLIYQSGGQAHPLKLKRKPDASSIPNESLLTKLLAVTTTDERLDILRRFTDNNLLLYGNIPTILKNCELLSPAAPTQKPQVPKVPNKRSRSPTSQEVVCTACSRKGFCMMEDGRIIN